MKHGSVFTDIFSLEDGDVTQTVELTADDLVDTTNDVMECAECQKDLEKDIVSLENNILAYEKLEKQHIKNEQALEEDKNNEISQIQDEDIIISQETLLTTLRTLGYSSKDLKALTISSEARQDKYVGLAISNEGIIDSIKQIIKGIINLFISIGKKIKFYVTKFINWLTNRKGSLQKMMLFCHQNKDLELPILDSGVTSKISNFHSAYLETNNGVLDVTEVIKFYSEIGNDPFVVRVNDFLDIINQPADKIQGAAEKLTNEIQRAAEGNSLHKKLIALANKSSKESPIYILGVNGNKLTSYNYANKEKDDKYKLGFSLTTYKLNSSGSYKEIKGCKTLGDLGDVIKEILVAVDTAGSFGQQIERANSNAIKAVETFSKKLKDGSIADSIQREVINHTLKIVKDMGSRSLVVLINNHAINTGNLAKTVSYYVKPLIKANKKAEKLAAKQK